MIRKLMEYIPIDSYGKCLNNKKWPEGVKGIKELMKAYTFYLAFENSNCKDYVTEKLVNAVEAGVVPVVDGKDPRISFISFTSDWGWVM